MGILDDELRARIKRLEEMCEETNEVVRQMLEAVARTDRHDDDLENRVDASENSGE